VRPSRRVILTALGTRESFDGIYLDLSKQSGKCRFADSGLGWKPSAGGDTFTLDGTNITSANWSRASKGYEVKVFTRTGDIIQLDGFVQEVGTPVLAIALRR
jgi:structure-specific recognition protein 1